MYFLLFSSAAKEEKIAELFHLLASEVRNERGATALRVIYDKSGKLERIFEIMVYLTCTLAIENVIHDEHRRKDLGKPTFEQMIDL